MKNLFWRVAARVLSSERVTDWLIKRATKTPYHHLASADGEELYMARYWLLNPYDRETHKVKYSWLPWSIRLHFIYQPDKDHHMHDHPWDARTVILRGGYREQVPGDDALRDQVLANLQNDPGLDAKMFTQAKTVSFSEYHERLSGYTGVLKHGQVHRIDKIHEGCAVTLFITGKYKGPWGFLVAGKMVPWRKYLGLEETEDLVSAPDPLKDFPVATGAAGCPFTQVSPKVVAPPAPVDVCPIYSDGKHHAVLGTMLVDGLILPVKRCSGCCKEL